MNTSKKKNKSKFNSLIILFIKLQTTNKNKNNTKKNELTKRKIMKNINS